MGGSAGRCVWDHAGMKLKKLMEHFPGAAEAYKEGKAWAWEPRFEDGYPYPVVEDGEWVMKTCYPGFVMNESEATVRILEMDVPGWDCQQVNEGARHEVDRRTRYKEVGTIPLVSSNEKQIKDLFLGLSHSCWMATREYFEFGRHSGRDPLRFYSDGEDSEEVKTKAMSELVEHLSNIHAEMEAIRAAGVANFEGSLN